MRQAFRHAVFLALAAALPVLAESVLFEDPFAGKLAEGWTVLRGDPAGLRVEKGALRVRIVPGNMWGPANDARNVLVRPLPDAKGAPLRASVHVENKPTAQYEQVDLVWYYDDSHMVKIGLELVHGQLSLVMGREEKDKTRTIIIVPLTDTSIDLRLTADGTNIRGEFRTPGADWRLAGECDLPVNGEAKISLQCYQGPADAEHWAKITQFQITAVEK